MHVSLLPLTPQHSHNTVSQSLRWLRGGSAVRCPPCGCVHGRSACASTCWCPPPSLQSGSVWVRSFNFPEERTLHAWTPPPPHRDFSSQLLLLLLLFFFFSHEMLIAAVRPQPPRGLAQDWTRGTFSHAPLRATAPGPRSAHSAQVAEHRDRSRGGARILCSYYWSFLLGGESERSVGIGFVQWLLSLDLKFYSGICNLQGKLVLCLRFLFSISFIWWKIKFNFLILIWLPAAWSDVLF